MPSSRPAPPAGGTPRARRWLRGSLMWGSAIALLVGVMVWQGFSWADARRGFAAAGVGGVLAIAAFHLVPLVLDAVNVDFAFVADGIECTATASLTGRTGVEMEALTAVSLALLTIYDMAKALDKGMVIESVRLIEKRGGKSGTWRAPE